MKLITGLFRAARKRLALTQDNDMGMFRDKLNELIEQKDGLSDEEIGAKVDELKGFIADLPDGDDKAKLDRFLEDFRSVKEQDMEVAKEAGNSVADLFEKLDTAAMQDVPEAVGGDDVVEETTEVAAEEEGTGDDVQVSEEVTEETVAPETTEEVEEETEEDVTDADPDPEYSLEEIYQFIKKRMAEDAEGVEEETEEELEEEVEDEEPQTVGEYVKENVEEDIEHVTGKDKGVCDAAPFIPVTMNRNAGHNGGLAEMFAAIKNGGSR